MVGCQSQPPSGGAPIHVQLLAFNDFHGNLEPPTTPTRLPADAAGAPDVLLPTGGAAWLSGLIHELRRDNPATLVVAAGDLVGASPLVSALLKHEPSIAALNQIGLQYSSVGNHEFDHGVAELQRLAGLAKFGYLAANVVVRSTGQTLFPAWARARVRTTDGRDIDVALVGAVLHDTPSLVSGNMVAPLEFRDEADSINAAVRQIRAAGIEIIIVLIHEGGFVSSTRFDESGCPGFRGPILSIVERLDPAVDVVVSGHTHRTYICRHAGRLVTSAGNEGRFLTDIDLTIDPLTRDVSSSEARQLPVINDTRPNPLVSQYPQSPLDEVLAGRVTRWHRSVAPLAERRVGNLTGEWTRRPNAAGETGLGQLVVDAQLEATAAPDRGAAQIAFVNNGGLRADLLPRNGQVTHADVFAVHPFGNVLVTLNLTGRQIHQLLEAQWLNAGSLLQVSRGFSYSWSASAKPGQRIAPADIRLNGAPLQQDAVYRVTVNDFLAGGGDGYTALQAGTDRLTGDFDVDVLERYLNTGVRQATPAGGRVQLLP
ncbi:MAG TPA: bifunctional metallophosphatase/5'-nucleotidase [Steroidobacteraceae bacterium]|nr:bifunctional metallophosphatase/5'-nucleotidase [Steroidobacteraceae bacterium]